MHLLSVIVPCYNEERSLSECIDRVLAIRDAHLDLEIIIIDDCSTDGSLAIARNLEQLHPQITVLSHKVNKGKGAALRTGFERAKGDFVAVQDADLEYDPADLKNLIRPLAEGRADVVIGSRFISSAEHRVLYFWHYLGNQFLTFLSNMFTDLNLTDMESCYKVFKKEVIDKIRIEEERFGFEPEIVAKIAHMRLRIYEMGISYCGRTYEEGKKIGMKDGFRALYCVFRYNAYRAPLPVQFMIYLLIGGASAAVNLFAFLLLMGSGLTILPAAGSAFLVGAAFNYILCILFLFRHKARWNSLQEIVWYMVIVILIGMVDVTITSQLIAGGMFPGTAKITATLIGLVLNFLGRRYLVFPERALQ
jgi:glycosyltransferase involved in cell wall biosynthesis